MLAEESTRQRVKPLIVIKASSGWASVNLAEIWQFRDLLVTLAARDVKLRYRQTALGAIWVVLQPLMAAGIFAFVFGRVANLAKPGDPIPYFVLSYVGLLGWNIFASTLGKISGSLIGNAGLVSKVYFPRLILPLSTVCSTLVDFGVASILLVLLMIANHIVPGPGLLLLPVFMVLLLMLSIGVGLAAAALTVTYRDVQYVLPVLTNLLLYASPVAYTIADVLHRIPAHLHWAVYLNPLASLIEGFRWSILGRGAIHPAEILGAALASAVVFAWGALSFKKMERRFADVI